MSFRERMKRRQKSLGKRHNAGTKKTGGGRFPTIFNKEKIPEGIEFWSCREGSHIVDIIPFEAGPDMPFDDKNQPISDEGDLDYVLDLFVHMNVGNMKRPFVCPYENFGKPCPICEFIKANRLEKDDWSKLVAKHRVVYLVWVHDDRDQEKKGIQIFEASHFFMEEKIEEIAKLPRGGGFTNFSDPDEGKSLAWTRKGSGQKDTRYIGHRFVDREIAIPDRILDKSFSLDQVVNMYPSYEEIEKEFRGTLKQMDLGDYEDEDDDTPFPDDEDGYGDDIPDDHVEPKKRKRPTDRKRPTSKKPTGKKKRPKTDKKPTGKVKKTTSGKVKRKVRPRK